MGYFLHVQSGLLRCVLMTNHPQVPCQGVGAPAISVLGRSLPASLSWHTLRLQAPPPPHASALPTWGQGDRTASLGRGVCCCPFY